MVQNLSTLRYTLGSQYMSCKIIKYHVSSPGASSTSSLCPIASQELFKVTSITNTQLVHSYCIQSFSMQPLFLYCTCTTSSSLNILKGSFNIEPIIFTFQCIISHQKLSTQKLLWGTSHGGPDTENLPYKTYHSEHSIYNLPWRSFYIELIIENLLCKRCHGELSSMS